MLEFTTFFQKIKRHWLLMTLTTLFTFGLTVFLTFTLVQPKYTSEINILVSESVLADKKITLTQALGTYKSILTTPVIIRPIQRELQENHQERYTQTQLKKQLALSTSEESQIFSLVATASSKTKADHLATTSAKIFRNRINRLINPNGLQALTLGTHNIHKKGPNRWLTATLGLLAGLLLSFLLMLWREIGSSKIKTATYLNETAGLPVLGTLEIPADQQKGA